MTIIDIAVTAIVVVSAVTITIILVAAATVVATWAAYMVKNIPEGMCDDE